MNKRYLLVAFAVLVLAFAARLLYDSDTLERMHIRDNIDTRMQNWKTQRKQKLCDDNLHHLRNAIGMFQADTGVYPVELIDLTAPPTTARKPAKQQCQPTPTKVRISIPPAASPIPGYSSIRLSAPPPALLRHKSHSTGPMIPRQARFNMQHNRRKQLMAV